MRILLDESLPAELAAEIPGHEVRTVHDLGWASLKNGELLARCAREFDAFVTADQNLQFQQNLKAIQVAVVILAANSNRISALRPLIPGLLEALGTTPRGSSTRVAA